MTVTEHRCITVACDTCGMQYGEDSDFIAHFDDFDAAAKQMRAARWIVGGDRRLQCYHCVSRASCALVGHQPMQLTAAVWCCESCGDQLDAPTPQERP
jgi:hypothetical protein